MCNVLPMNGIRRAPNGYAYAWEREVESSGGVGITLPDSRAHLQTNTCFLENWGRISKP